MKTSQYIRQETAIAAADAGGMRERWIWGLRLLRDPDAFSPGSSQLKPGRADELVAAAKAAGRKLSAREIQRRLQCARAYRTESEFRQALAEFSSWFDLADANFPRFGGEEGDLPADHRTDTERKRDLARAIADMIGEQGTLFPLDRYEPTAATLKELAEYAAEMSGLTARFAARDQERADYLAALVEAADGDMSTTWQAAHVRAYGDDVTTPQVPEPAGAAPCPPAGSGITPGGTS